MREWEVDYENEVVGKFYLHLLNDFHGEHGSEESGIYDFMKNIYKDIIEKPEVLGVEKIEACLLERDENFSKNGEFNKVKNKVIKPISDFLNLLFKVLSEGELNDGEVVLTHKDLKKFMKTRKPMKRKMIEYLVGIGISIVVDASEEKWTFLNTGKLKILHDLRAFAIECKRIGEEKFSDSTNMGMYLFLACRFDIVRENKDINNTHIFNNILNEMEVESIEKIHNKLLQAKSSIEYLFEPHVINFEIRYKNKEIKKTPFCVFVWDYKRKNSFLISMKFPALKRIIPMINKQDESVKKEFLSRGTKCNSCGWCKEKTAIMKPVDFEVNGVRETLCWYLDSQFDRLDDDEMKKIEGFVDAHLLLGVS